MAQRDPVVSVQRTGRGLIVDKFTVKPIPSLCNFGTAWKRVSPRSRTRLTLRWTTIDRGWEDDRKQYSVTFN